MSKFRCKSGYLIGFNDYPCRYDANVIRSQGSEDADEALTQVAAEFIAFVREGRRDGWLQQFYGEVFPLEDASVISDIITRHMSDYMLALHQCEQCGRLWLQRKPGEQVYVPYLPDGYAPYLPEGAWRGALERPAAGFLGYIEGQDFFDAEIAEVQQESERVRVILKREHTEDRVITFIGVSAVTQHDRERKRVRFLSEWESTPPRRRFLFDSTGQSFEPLLEITAVQVHLGS